MKNRVFLSAILIALGCTAPVYAEEADTEGGPAQAPNMTLSNTTIQNTSWVPQGAFSLGWGDKMYKTRVNTVASEEAVMTFDLTLNLPKGFYVRGWLATGTNDWELSSDRTDEFDIWLGRKWKAFNLDFHGYVNYVGFHPMDEATDDVWITSLAAAKTFPLGEFEGKHSLRFEIRADCISTIDTGDVAMVYLPNMTHTWAEPFGLKSLSWFSQLAFHHNDSFRTLNDRTSLQWYTGLNWKITPSVTITPNFFLGVPLNDSSDGEETITSGGISATITF